MVSAAPTSPLPVGSEGAAALVVALAAALGGAMGWGGARLCDSLVRFFIEEDKGAGRGELASSFFFSESANWEV